MPYLFIFAAGIFIGSKLNKVRKTLAPYVGNAAEQFDQLYSQVGQKVGQTYEAIEDKIAEKRYHAASNGASNNSHSNES